MRNVVFPQAHLKTLEDRGVLFLPFEQRMAADRRELRVSGLSTLPLLGWPSVVSNVAKHSDGCSR